jgi:ribosomal protein S18 acetylase RimI-like enzyme
MNAWALLKRRWKRCNLKTQLLTNWEEQQRFKYLHLFKTNCTGMLSIITAGTEHASLLSKLSTITFFDTYSNYNTPENMTKYCDNNFTTEQLATQLIEPNTVFFIAFFNGMPAGFTKMRRAENPEELIGKKHIEVERIYVLKDFQGKKIGYELIQRCIEYATQSHFEVIWLGVWQQNAKALAFYQKIGFTIFSKHSFLLGDDDQTDWLMKLELKN